MKTLADLKRELVPGRKITLLQCFTKTVNEPRELIQVQTNAWIFKTPTKSRSYLEIPKASLLEFDGVIFKIFLPGKRPLTPEEKAIMDKWETLRDRKQEEIDALSDGSTSYYQKKAYFRENNALYLFGIKDYENSIIDDAIKGKIELIYKLES